MTSSPPTVIAAFLQDHPGIRYATRTSADYPALRVNYVSNPALPLIILRPQTADDVAAIIIYCVAQNLDFVVRGGGHDLCGRSTVQDAVTIDLRDITHIQVSADKKTARIGGGILFSKLLEGLGTHGLITSVGTIGTVGYVGWATLGGYGPYSSSYGLGLDQVVGAKVVNADGRLVDADARMLKGIRGSGGNYGVIVELTVKVYPVQEIQAGMVIYDSSALATSLTTYFENYNKLLTGEDLPSKLSLQPVVFNIPDLGPTFMVMYVWNGPNTDDAKRWLSLISGLAPVIQSDVTTKTPLIFLDELTKMIPSATFGGSQTVSLAKYTPQAISIIAKHVPFMPRDPCTGFGIHPLSGPSCRPPLPDSVWRHREPHFMVEILGMASSQETCEASQGWAKHFRNELKEVEGALPGTYFPLTAKENIDLEKIYGEHLGELMALKEEYDPNRVFKRAVPQL